MVLIGRAMALLLPPARTPVYHLIDEAASCQVLKVVGQDFIERIGSNQANGRDLDHRPPRFSPLLFRKANGEHRLLLATACG